MGANFSAVLEHNLYNNQSLESFLEVLNNRNDLFSTIHKVTNNNGDQWWWARKLYLANSFDSTPTNWVRDLIKNTGEAKKQKRYKYSSIWEEVMEEGTITLMSPDSVFSMLINQNILELSCLIRWSSFLKDKKTQSSLRCICKELCSYFKKSNCIYMSETFCASDYIYDGKSMEEYMNDLLERFGNPKQTIDEMYVKLEEGWGWTSEGYYIDSFNIK